MEVYLTQENQERNVRAYGRWEDGRREKRGGELQGGEMQV